MCLRQIQTESVLVQAVSVSLFERFIILSDAYIMLQCPSESGSMCVGN